MSQTATHGDAERPVPEEGAPVGMSLAELMALPVAFNLDTANRVLLLGRTKGFDLAKRGQYPCRVLRVGSAYRVTRADLFRTLGMSPMDGAAGSSHPTAPAENAPLTTSAN